MKIIKKMMRPLCPGGSPRQSIAVSILNFQGNLNASRSLCAAEGAETTGKVLVRATASRRAQGNKWTVHISVTYSEDMPVKDVEKRCPKVDCGPLPEEPGFLAEREVFVLGCEPPGRSKGPGFGAKRQRTCGRECGRIPEWRGEGLEIAFVGLIASRNYIYARGSGEVASAKHHVAGRTSARAVDLCGCS